MSAETMKPLLIISMMFMIISSLNSQYVGTLVAYDCHHPESGTIRYKIPYDFKCDVSNDHQPLVQNNELTVLSIPSEINVEMLTCFVKVYARIEGCGVGSHGYAVNLGTQVFTVPLTEDECRQLHLTNKYTLNSVEAENLKPNVVNSVAKNFKGITNDGCLDDQEFKLNGVTYKDSMASISLEIQYSTEKCVYVWDKDYIKCNSNLLCERSATSCYDTSGKSYYQKSPVKPDIHLSEVITLYHGSANISYSTILDDKIDFFTINVNNTLALLESRDITMPLGNIILQGTNMPNIYYFLGVTTHPLSKLPLSDTVNPDYIRELLLDTQLSLLSYEGWNNDVQHRRLRKQIECERMKELLRIHDHNKQVLNSKLGFLLTNERGYSTSLGYDTFSLHRCVTVNVEHAPVPGCYEALPVYYKTEIKYRSPITYVLEETTHNYTCSQMFPTIVQAQNVWYNRSPEGLMYPLADVPENFIHTNEIKLNNFVPIGQTLELEGILTQQKISEYISGTIKNHYTNSYYESTARIAHESFSIPSEKNKFWDKFDMSEWLPDFSPTHWIICGLGLILALYLMKKYLISLIKSCFRDRIMVNPSAPCHGQKVCNNLPTCQPTAPVYDSCMIPIPSYKKK